MPISHVEMRIHYEKDCKIFFITIIGTQYMFNKCFINKEINKILLVAFYQVLKLLEKQCGQAWVAFLQE